MSFNIRDYVSDDHIESIGEIATGQARIIQVLTLDNSQKDKEIERLNNIINELEKEIDRLLERQYASERFAKEQGFDTYLPAKENLLCVKNKLQELKGSNNN